MKNESVMNQLQFNVQKINNGIISNGPDGPTHFKNELDLFSHVCTNSILSHSQREAFGFEESSLPNLLDNPKLKNGYQLSIVIGELPEVIPVLTKKESIRNLIDEVIKSGADVVPEEVLENLRISVNRSNAYKSEVLSKYDFMKQKEKFKLTTKDLAKIVGKSEMGFYQTERSINKGIQTFENYKTRMTLTILIKYYEMIGGAKAKMVNELASLKDVVEKIAYELRLRELNGGLTDPKVLGSYAKTLFEAIGTANMPNKSMAIEFLKHR